MCYRNLTVSICLILFSVNQCLQTKRSGFDSSKPQSAVIQYLAGISAVFIPSGVSVSSSPSSTYSGSKDFSSAVPGEYFELNPGFTGQISSISLSPSTLPAGISFDPSTGKVSGTPTLTNSGFPSTEYTITAVGPNGAVTFTFQLGVLGSGANVWTKVAGVSGGNTLVQNGSLFFYYDVNNPTDSTKYFLAASGSTDGNLDGEVNSSPAITSAYVTAYKITGERKWTKILSTSGTGTRSSSSGIGIDSSGNIYISGTATNTNNGATGLLDGITIPTAGCCANMDMMFVSKFTSSGTKSWTSARNAARNSGISNTVDSSGNSFTSGVMQASSLDGQTNSGFTDDGMTLIKHDTNGAWTATRVLSATSAVGGSLAGLGITTDSSGNIFIAGYSNAGTRCGTVAPTAASVLIKYNSSMTYQWCQGLGTAGLSTSANSLTVDSSGNIYLTGYTYGNLDGITRTGSMDMFIIKYNSAGTKQWTKLLGVAGANTMANSIVISNDGSGNYLYVTGYTEGNLDGQTKTGVRDLFIAKYDLSGTRQWTKLLGSAGSSTNGNAIAFDNNGTMYAAGSINGDIAGQTNPAAPNNALMITRFVK